MNQAENKSIRGTLMAGAIALGLSWGCAQSGQTLPPVSPTKGSEARESLPELPAPESAPDPGEQTSGESVARPDTAPAQEEPSAAKPGVAPTVAADEAQPASVVEDPTETSDRGDDTSPDFDDTAPDAYVALAQFTTEIDDREPVDAISFLDNRSREIIFFTDIRGFAGQTLVHRWEYRGQVMGNVPFHVKQDRWRTWSRKQLLPVWLGDWTVSVVKPNGEVIAAETFNYSEYP